MKDGALLPSLKILAVKVRFSHDKEVKMLHTLLRCFPCLETLHIMVVSASYLFIPILVHLLWFKIIIWMSAYSSTCCLLLYIPD